MNQYKPGLNYVRSENNGEWFAVLVASNGNELWRSTETYKRIESAKGSVHSLYRFFTGNSYEVIQATAEIIDNYKPGDDAK